MTAEETRMHQNTNSHIPSISKSFHSAVRESVSHQPVS